MLEDSYIEDGYTELFDFTFEFIPRMCEKYRSAVCFFKELKEPGCSRWMDLCVNNPEEECPLVMYYCDFKMKCKGGKYELRRMNSIHSL